MTDQKLVEERVELSKVPTTQLIKDIRSSIEILLSIKNDQTNTNNGAGNMDTLMMQDESVADRSSMLSGGERHPFHTQSARSLTNPFERAGKNGKEGPGGAASRD